MMRNIGKKVVTLIATLIVLQTFTVALASTVQPWYIGLSNMMPNVEIDASGRAKCSDTVRLKNGYTASVTWRFQILSGSKWETKATWTGSGSGTLYLNKGYNVVRGSSCRLYTSVVVYNSSRKIVETPTKVSNTANY